MSRSGIAVTLAFGLLAASGVVAMAQDDQPGLVTEEVEPGVERIISDGAGHDLDATHPTYRYDMDAIAVTPDGTVWLSTTYSRGDNAAKPPYPLVWALGQPGVYMVAHEVPSTSQTYLYVQPDGTRVVIAYEVVSSEDGASIPDFGRADPWQIEAGDRSCRTTGHGVTCADVSDNESTFLAGTQINQIVAAPDGTIWVVGGYAGDNGGLYRITLE